MDNNDYKTCYMERKNIGLVVRRAGHCAGGISDIKEMIIDLNCLSCPYLDPIRKSMWKPGKFELDTEEDPQPKFIRNACLVAQMNANNVDEEGFCFGSKNYLGEKCKTCKKCIYFVKNKEKLKENC